MILRPLAQTRAEQAMFVNRNEETREITRAATNSQAVLILGESGSGRTTLLYHLAWLVARDQPPRQSVILSGESAANAAQLLGILIARTYRMVDSKYRRAEWLTDLNALALPDGPFGDVVQPAILMELIDLLSEAIARVEQPVCLMIDGIHPAVAHSIFGTLRNELWTLEGVSWIVTADSSASGTYLEPPADAFFEVTVKLSELTQKDAHTLLKAHDVDLQEKDFQRALEIGKGNPRRILRAAAEIQAGGSPSDSSDNQYIHKAENVAGRLAGQLVEYIINHGPTSASDAKMLHQIGASRQRASQLLHQLHSSGILHPINSHDPGHRGRPARKFTLKERDE